MRLGVCMYLSAVRALTCSSRRTGEARVEQGLTSGSSRSARMAKALQTVRRMDWPSGSAQMLHHRQTHLWRGGSRLRAGALRSESDCRWLGQLPV